MKRRPSHELLDSDAGTPEEVANSIRDLAMFNRFFGGISTTEKLVRAAATGHPRRSISLLEVAAGDGYLPSQVGRRLEPNVTLNFTVLDRARPHLNGNPRAVNADALHLPFADRSFDLVSCNLFVHHLDAHEIKLFAIEALRVARIALLINDLVRNPLHLLLSYAGFPLYRSRITRNDAPASVRQAYTPDELVGLLQTVGAKNIQLSRHYLYRMGIIAWKPA